MKLASALCAIVFAASSHTIGQTRPAEVIATEPTTAPAPAQMPVFIPPPPDLSTPESALVEVKLARATSDITRLKVITAQTDDAKQLWKFWDAYQAAQDELHRALSEKLPELSGSSLGTLPTPPLDLDRFRWEREREKAQLWVKSLDIRVAGDTAQATRLNDPPSGQVTVLRRDRDQWKLVDPPGGFSQSSIEALMKTARLEALRDLAKEVRTGTFKSAEEFWRAYTQEVIMTAPQGVESSTTKTGAP
jgi:hypothetical protein